MPLCEIDADHVLDELAEIAFAVPGEGLGDGAKTEGVVIVDSES